MPHVAAAQLELKRRTYYGIVYATLTSFTILAQAKYGLDGGPERASKSNLGVFEDGEESMLRYLKAPRRLPWIS